MHCTLLPDIRALFSSRIMDGWKCEMIVLVCLQLRYVIQDESRILSLFVKPVRRIPAGFCVHNWKLFQRSVPLARTWHAPVIGEHPLFIALVFSLSLSFSVLADFSNPLIFTVHPFLPISHYFITGTEPDTGTKSLFVEFNICSTNSEINSSANSCEMCNFYAIEVADEPGGEQRKEGRGTHEFKFNKASPASAAQVLSLLADPNAAAIQLEDILILHPLLPLLYRWITTSTTIHASPVPFQFHPHPVHVQLIGNCVSDSAPKYLNLTQSLSRTILLIGM